MTRQRRSTARCARAAHSLARAPAPRLQELADAIEPSLSTLGATIGRAVEDDGSALRDTASLTLRRLRRELRDSARRVDDAMQRLVRSAPLRAHLQESFVTTRAGRPVLAVKATSRASVPGIVHDASGSGQALFVEPFEVAELDNRQSEAAAEEREEVARLLAELSESVGGRAEALITLAEAVGELDLAIARGTLSRGWRGAPVV